MLNTTITKQVKAIIFQHLNPKDYKIFIFGSRARGMHAKYSDIDIGIEGSPLPAKTKIELEEAFEESDLPYNVDIVDFSTVSEKFKQVAKQHTIAL